MALRGTARLLKQFIPDPGCPTQTILRHIQVKAQPLTVGQLWDEMKSKTEMFPSKVWMKRVLDSLRMQGRIVSKPMDPAKKGTQFVYVLSTKPLVVVPDGGAYDESAGSIFETKKQAKERARQAEADAHVVAANQMQ